LPHFNYDLIKKFKKKTKGVNFEQIISMTDDQRKELEIYKGEVDEELKGLDLDLAC
jgi:hypothetical protein